MTNIKSRSKAALFAVLLTSMFMLMPLFSGAQAAVPASSSWTGAGAMAYWNVKNSTGSTMAAIQVVLAEQSLDTAGNPDPAKPNMLYIDVYHPDVAGGRDSEVTTYNVPFTWSSGTVYVRALNVNFPWGTSPRAHNITITWTAATLAITIGQYADRNSTTVNAPGAWCNATATITIDDETGPHPSIYTSDWAVIGASMKVVGTYRDWQVLTFQNRIYVTPPSTLTRMPHIQSVGAWDAAFYAKLGWSQVDVAKLTIDECMSSPYLR